MRIDGSICSTNIPTVGIKQERRYNYESCSALNLLVGPARFELATNGLKVLLDGTIVNSNELRSLCIILIFNNI